MNIAQFTFSKPKLEIPVNLKGTNQGFTNQSVVKRLPDIANKMYNYVKSTSSFPEILKERLQNLIKLIPFDKIPDVREGNKFEDDEYWTKYEEELEKNNWLEVDWIFTETYFYRAVNIITGNLVPLGSQKPINGIRDPFRNQKEEALTSLPEKLVKSILERQNQFILEDKQLNLKHLEQLILACLSGNQADLSMWPGMQINEKSNTNENYLIVNHMPQVVSYIESFNKLQKQIKIVYFFDNVGLELFSDLCLIDYLLNKYSNLQIIAYLKPVPAFVSDTTPWDLSFTLQYLSKTNKVFVQRIESYIAIKQLEIKASYFSINPQPLWDAPEGLQKEITTADLNIFKGDLNYRKILGDREWNFDQNFNEVVAYINAKILVLRTGKSMVGVGVDKEFKVFIYLRMKTQDPEWMSSGKYEFIQANF